MNGVGRHLRTLREVALACRDAAGTTPMPEPVLPALRDLIGYDSAGFVGIDNSCNLEYLFQEFAPVCDAPSISHEEEGAVFWEHERANRCAHVRLPDNVSSILTEIDGESVRLWHSCPLYVDMAKPNGNEHNLILRIPDGFRRTFQLIFWRGLGRAFSDADKADLLLLQPHIEAAYRRGRRAQAVKALTPRQRQILALVAEGLTNHQIARRLGTAEGTVRIHLNQIYSRLGVSSRTEAVTRSLISVEA